MMMGEWINSYTEVDEPRRHPSYYDLSDTNHVHQGILRFGHNATLSDMYYSIHGRSQEDEKLKQANLILKFHAHRNKFLELYEKDEYEQISELLPESDNISAYNLLSREKYNKYDNVMKNIDFDEDWFDLPGINQNSNLIYPMTNSSPDKTTECGGPSGKMFDEVTYEFLSLCIKENDVEFLKKIILKNNCTDLFNLRQNRGLIETIVTNNKEEICRVILDDMTLDNITIVSFFTMMVQYQTINLITIFSEYGHKLEVDYITTAIRLNYTDVVKYAILNNFDVQEAFNNCKFFQGEYTTSSPNKLFMLDGKHSDIDVLMLKLLESYNINILDKMEEISAYAAESNKLDLITYCVENHKCDVNIALRISCFFGNIDIMVYLLQNEANINVICESDIRCTNIDMIKFLTERNYVIPTRVLNSAFMVSFLHTDDLTNVKWLLDLGAEPLAIFSRESHMGLNPDRYRNLQVEFNKKYETLNSHLEYMVSMGKKSHIKYLADTYFDKLSPELDRLFIIACCNGQIDMMEYLLDIGADINFTNNLALKSACYFGQLDVVKLLLYRGLDLNSSENLFLFVANGFPSNMFRMESVMYTKLIANGDIFRNDIYRHGKQNAEIIKFLMENDVRAPDCTIFEVLPVELYSTELLAYLISSGIDINTTFKDGSMNRITSVLESSIQTGNLEIVKSLLENKADVKINDNGPIKRAKNTHDAEIINLLVEYGASLESEYDASYSMFTNSNIYVNL